VSSTQVNLSWAASTDNVGTTGYRVYRDGVQVGAVSVLSFQDVGLTANTTYAYRVSAVDAAGNESAQSGAVSATTPVIDTSPPSVSITAPPAGAIVSGTVTVSATSSDAGSGVHDVQFFVEGIP
jgi:chitodextrinase